MPLVPRRALLAALAASLVAGPPVRAGEAAAPSSLPSSPDDIVFVGDSVAAGVYFLYLSDASAEQGWAAQVLARCGLPVPSTRLPGAYPLDHLDLARRGAGFLGIRYLVDAAGALFGSRDPLFEAGEARSLVAVPGQTLENVLRQSSDDHGSRETGWLFAALFLPRDLTTVETVERAANRPKWIVLSIGANDVLSAFGIVGGAKAPDPATFERDYRELTARLRATMHPESAPEQLLCLTVPDATALPFVQPVPDGARDDFGRPLPAGTVTSALLPAYGRRRFDDDEVWTPAELDSIRGLASGYDTAIRRIAEEGGFGVVELQALLLRLREAADFADVRSPYFSPDLHHPSWRLHADIADVVVTEMSRIAGTPAPAAVPFSSAGLPTAAELTNEERERARLFTRVGLLGLERGQFPPGPTFRTSVEIGGLAGVDRPGSWAMAVQAGLELGPAPATTRWVSRLALQARSGAVWVPEDDDFRRFPAQDSDVRLALAFEPVGRWEWTRIEVGPRWAFAGGFGAYARTEWRKLYLESVTDGFSPRRVEAGVRLGAAWLRPGHNGN